jgi:tripartite-type tricarboxylate transporter receptor subunit TctC
MKLICVLACMLFGPAFAQGTWPAKPVRMVVTFTQGGSADLTARLVGEKLSEVWQQQVVVENRIGAGGNIGVEAVYRSAPDGYTLLLGSGALLITAALYPNVPFDLLRDFAPIALVSSAPFALAVHPSVKESNLREFTARLRAQPGRTSYATCGVATGHHFAFELYKFQTRTFALHIPYRGCGPAVVDTAGGQIDTVMAGLATVLPYHKAGRLKVLAVTTKSRSPSAPDVPTFRESGIPELKDYDVNNYYGFMAPAATPRDVLAKIEADVFRVMAQPELQQRITGAGMEIFLAGSQEMVALMRTDAVQVRKIVDFAGIKPE